MFLASNKQAYQSNHQTQVGTTTIGGNPAGVYLSGERRNLSVMTPKGYSWTPSEGDGVLVLKSGAQGECGYVAGVPMEETLPAGAVKISNGDGSAYILLSEDGTISLVGDIVINGTTMYQSETGGNS